MVTNFHHFVNFVCCVACFGDDGFGVEGSSRGLKNPKARKVFVFHHLKMSIGISGWVKASNKVEYMDIHWLQFLSRADFGLISVFWGHEYINFAYFDMNKRSTEACVSSSKHGQCLIQTAT